ncbi:MAG: hypothetical protein GX932_05430 [Methanomicrobiales archaeon]|nr:hypothetical protein [Methanomicrobiales archaeon]
MIQTRDGGYAITGTGTNADVNGPVPRIVTLDRDGNVISTMTFGTSPDYGSSLVEAPDGGYVVATYSGFLTRVDENRNTLWSTPLGGGSDWWKVVGAPGGGYAAAGDARIVRVGEDGKIAWTAAFETDRNVDTIAAIPSGGFIAGGTARADVWVARLDAGGNTVWDETLGSRSRDDLYVVRISPAGTYDLVYGTVQDAGNETADGRFTETTEASLAAVDGRLIGERPLNASRVVVATEDGGYAYAGFIVPEFIGLQPQGYPGSPLHVVRLDDEGMVAWDASYDIGDDRSVVSIIRTSDDGVAVLGSVYDF